MWVWMDHVTLCVSTSEPYKSLVSMCGPYNPLYEYGWTPSISGWAGLDSVSLSVSKTL